MTMTLSTENAIFANRTAGIALGFMPDAEDHIAVEVGRLLEDVRRALDEDLSAAKMSAVRLSAFLDSKFPTNIRSAPLRGGLAPWQKRKVRNYIEDELERPVPVEDLARLVSLSASYFCRAFKESFGAPPHSYVIQKRVERARTLMLTTSESLSQIAIACGLVDQAHLCKCFRQTMGVSPGAWRRCHATGA
jgi:AraC family transcriptional regulator